MDMHGNGGDHEGRNQGVFPLSGVPLSLLSRQGSRFFSDKRSWCITEEADHQFLNYCVNGQLLPLFLGWVPCLSGRLRFSLSEPVHVHYDRFVFNNAFPLTKTAPDYSTRRHVLVSSAYDWQDSGGVGLARMVVIATAVTPERLVGNVYFIPLPDKPSRDFKRGQQELCERLLEIESKYGNDQGDRERLERILDISDCIQQSSGNRLVDHLGAMPDAEGFLVQFEIDIAGFTYLCFIGKKEKLGNRFFCPDGVSSDDSGLLVRQAFYYLKYLFHKHSHHDHSTDSLTTVHRLCANGDAMSLVLLKDIEEVLVDIKRDQKLPLMDHEGISSYARSLLVSCEQKLGFGGGEDKKKRPQIHRAYLDNLTASIGRERRHHPLFRQRLQSNLRLVNVLLATLFLFITPFMLVIIARANLTGLCDRGSIDIAKHFLAIRLMEEMLCGEYPLSGLLLFYLVIGGLAFSISMFLDKKTAFSPAARWLDWRLASAAKSPACNAAGFGKYLWIIVRTQLRLRRLRGKLRSIPPIYYKTAAVILVFAVLPILIYFLLGLAYRLMWSFYHGG